MSKGGKAPETLIEAIRYFSNPDVCLDYMARLRWPDGKAVCPTCGSAEVRFIATRRLWECKNAHARKQFSIKVGTIFEDSPIGLDKWLAVIWMLANSKNGVSSYEIARSIGVTQKTAWFMLQRIRLAMQGEDGGKLSGSVEIDETYVGGRARNMHESRKKGMGKLGGRNYTNKTVVMGLLERETGKFRYEVVNNLRRRSIQGKVRASVEPGSNVYTDAYGSYKGLESDYAHKVVDHAERYVDGVVHTNGLENFWSLLKRAIHGTYVSVEPFHLFRYLDEQSFRYNNREGGDSGRFAKVANGIVGKRLTYSKLTGQRLPGVA